MGACCLVWALCVAWAAAAHDFDQALPASAQAGEQAWPARDAQLGWLHSIERVRWEESYRLPEEAAAQAELTLQHVRIAGSGAGMEPPAEARWHDGGYVWSPGTRVARLLLTLSPFAAEHTLCVDGRCAPLGAWLPPHAPAAEGVVRLRACLTR